MLEDKSLQFCISEDGALLIREPDWMKVAQSEMMMIHFTNKYIRRVKFHVYATNTAIYDFDISEVIETDDQKEITVTVHVNSITLVDIYLRVYKGARNSSNEVCNEGFMHHIRPDHECRIKIHNFG